MSVYGKKVQWNRWRKTILWQRGWTSGPPAKYGSRPLVTVPAKLSGISCYGSKFKIICKFVVIYAHFNRIYILACTVALRYFFIKVLKYKENWPLCFINSARRSFFYLGWKGKTLFWPEGRKFVPPWSTIKKKTGKLSPWLRTAPPRRVGDWR
jgi:hypothetical protein